MRFAQQLCAAAAVAAAVASRPRRLCATDDDCSLLGVCSSNGTCACDPGWGGADCGVARLRDYDDVAHLGYVNASAASWGGRPLRVGGTWQLFATEIAAQCPLILFMNNSRVIRAESTTGSAAGPYAHRGVVRAAFAHNPTAVGPTPDGYYLVFSIGGAAAGSARPNPPSWLLDCAAPAGLPPCAARDQCRSHGTPAANGQVVLSYASDPVRGPWVHRVVLPIGGNSTTPPGDPGAWNCKHNNPSARVDPRTGAVTLMYHGSACDGSSKGERLGLADAAHWNDRYFSTRSEFLRLLLTHDLLPTRFVPLSLLYVLLADAAHTARTSSARGRRSSGRRTAQAATRIRSSGSTAAATITRSRTTKATATAAAAAAQGTAAARTCSRATPTAGASPARPRTAPPCGSSPTPAS